MSPLHDAPDEAPVVIATDRVSKNFVLRRDNSLKDRLLSSRAGRQNREAFTALDEVSIEVKAGHTVALIGHNGSGKSTLLKVIGGILDPTSGTIARRGRIAALLELGAGFHPDLSGRDNVFLNASLLGMSKEETEAVFDDIVSFAELEEFIDTQVKFYSSGMYVRLAFAVAVHTDPDILLVDEVLAVGDEAFQRKCMDTIRRFQAEGRTILLVTHNLGQVMELADSAVLLHHGKLVYEGEPRDAVAQFRDLLEERRLEHLAIHADDSVDVEHEGSPQSQAVKIIAHAGSPSLDGSAEALSIGETLRISVTLDGRIPVSDWSCAFQIDNTMGVKLFGTSTRKLGRQLDSLDGQLKLDFDLVDTRFGEGQYFVNVSIMSAEGGHLVDAPQACSFRAVSPEDGSGSLYFPAQLSISA